MADFEGTTLLESDNQAFEQHSQNFDDFGVQPPEDHLEESDKTDQEKAATALIDLATVQVLSDGTGEFVRSSFGNHLRRQAFLCKEALCRKYDVLPESVSKIGRTFEEFLFVPETKTDQDQQEVRLNFYPPFAVPECTALYSSFFNILSIPFSCCANRTGSEKLKKLQDITKYDVLPKFDPAMFVVADTLGADFWPKLVENFTKKNKPLLTLTISNAKSFYHFAGRVLASFVYAESNLKPNFNPLGANIWLHQWTETDIRCFHGQRMILKPITYNLSPASEEGMRAIQSGEGRLEKGRNQKDVVKLTNDRNIICYNDENVQWPIIHSQLSCGLNFGNNEKARAAMNHNIYWTSAMFPRANQTDIAEKMIIVTKCFCNYGHDNMQLGRQLCKITAFEIPGANDIDPESCNDNMLKATAHFKHTFVFQCCNPMNLKKPKDRDPVKHCDFKLSLIDVRQAIKISKEMWSRYQTEMPEKNLANPKLQLELFAFDPRKHSFKQAIVACHSVEEDEDAFC